MIVNNHYELILNLKLTLTVTFSLNLITYKYV